MCSNMHEDPLLTSSPTQTYRSFARHLRRDSAPHNFRQHGLAGRYLAGQEADPVGLQQLRRCDHARRLHPTSHRRRSNNTPSTRRHLFQSGNSRRRRTRNVRSRLSSIPTIIRVGRIPHFIRLWRREEWQSNPLAIQSTGSSSKRGRRNCRRTSQEPSTSPTCRKRAHRHRSRHRHHVAQLRNALHLGHRGAKRLCQPSLVRHRGDFVSRKLYLRHCISGVSVLSRLHDLGASRSPSANCRFVDVKLTSLLLFYQVYLPAAGYLSSPYDSQNTTPCATANDSSDPETSLRPPGTPLGAPDCSFGSILAQGPPNDSGSRTGWLTPTRSSKERKSEEDSDGTDSELKM